MKKYILLILKGMLIGLGKVIPGVSGSLIAVSLGVYEKAIHAIGHFFKNIKQNILFLGTLGLGILFSIAFGSQFILLGLEFFYLPTMLLFIGFIAGILPNLQKNCPVMKNQYLFFLGAFLFVIFLNFLSNNNTFVPDHTFFSYLIIIGIGFLDAATMIIPGISGTAIFMMLGCYPFILNLFSSISTVQGIFENFSFFICFGLGVILGIILVSYLVDYLLKNHKASMYAVIQGFTCSSLIILLQKTFSPSFLLWELVVGLILMLGGFFLSLKFSRE